MAKKKAATRKPSRKPAKPARTPKLGTSAKRQAAAREKAKAAKTRRKGPRQQALPGTVDEPVKALDNLCQSIYETRDAIADLQGEEAGLEQSALQLMRKHDRTTYQRHGVQLVRVPGEEKLQVKKARERTATAATLPSDATPEAAATSEGGLMDRVADVLEGGD